MLKHRFFFITFIAVLVATRTIAQFNIQIGNSSDNSFTKQKEGEIQATDPVPDSLQTSWLVNAFVETGFKFGDESHTIGVVAELHRNSLIAKKQHVEQIGLSGVFSFANSDASTMLITSVTGKYSNDKVKEKEAMQILAGLTIKRGEGKWYTPNSINPLNDLLAFEHDHNLGIASVNFDEAILLQAYGEMRIYFLHDLFYRLGLGYDALYGKISWNGRSVVGGDIENTKRLLRYGGGISINVNTLVAPDDDEKKFKVGFRVEQVDGADPLKGLFDQRYTTYGLSLVLKL